MEVWHAGLGDSCVAALADQTHPPAVVVAVVAAAAVAVVDVVVRKNALKEKYTN